MADRLAARREAGRAVGEVALVLLLADREAEVRAVAPAVDALAALGREERDDVVAGRERGDPVADPLDDAGALVPEHGRGVAGGVGAGGRVEVGVADATGDEPHEHLAGARLGQVDLLDRERCSELFEDGGPDSHQSRSYDRHSTRRDGTRTRPAGTAPARAARAARARPGGRAPGARGDLAGAGREPPVRLRRAPPPADGPQLLHDRLGGPREQRLRRPRPAPHRPRAPPLPLRRVLPRARRAGGARRRARHHARGHRGADRADRGRPAQGVRPRGAGGDPADLDDRVASPPRVRCRVRDRAGEEARRRLSVAVRRRRRLQLRRRVAQPRDGAGGAEQRGAHRAPGPAAAAAPPLRGQRPRDQRPLAAGLGRAGAALAHAAALRVRRRHRAGAGARDGARARRLDPRAPPPGRPAPAHGPLPQPRGRRRRVGLPLAAGDPRRLGRRPAARNRAPARGERRLERRASRRRLHRHGRPRARARRRGRARPAARFGSGDRPAARAAHRRRSGRAGRPRRTASR